MHANTKSVYDRIAATPAFPALQWFPQGRRFKQWMGDDSKALMKVHNNLPGCNLNPHDIDLPRFTCLQSQAMYHQKWCNAYPTSWTLAT